MRFRLSTVLIFAAMVATATASGCAVAPVPYSEPALNVDPARHGNLAAAQELVRGAYEKLSDAQYANHDELGGHAARAKALLREAGDEIKLAALAANRR